MKKLSTLVLSEPDMPQLSMLSELDQSADVVVGNTTPAFEKAAADAEVIFNLPLPGSAVSV